MPQRIDTLMPLIVILSLFGIPERGQAALPDTTWQAGVARTVITPEEPMWMAGYGSRDHPAEGTRDDLWVKALALEDADGRRAVLVTTDLLGLPKGISDHVRDRLASKLQLERDQVMLTSSHTHTGPVLQNALYDIYPLDEQEKAKIAAYSRSLETRIVETVADALSNLVPAQLSTGTGAVRFAVNRRNNEPPKVVIPTSLKGPADHSVPVLKIERKDGQLEAVVFSYACHATAFSGGFYQWSGGWPGMAQRALEKSHSGATALFVAGAGGDQNPIPRGAPTLPRQYGREMIAAVDRVLEAPMTSLMPRLETRYTEIDLALSDPPTREELHAIADEESGYHRRWAQRLLAKYDRGDSFRKTYPYPIQVWELGAQKIVALGGEAVVNYAIQLKQLLGWDLMVVAYANDVMGYIPTRRILREGGYEGTLAQRVYGLPSTWAPSIEEHIIQTARRLATQ